MTLPPAWRRLAIIFAIILGSAPLPAAAEESSGATKFSGSVARGESFAQALPGGLELQLRPAERGWRIWVSDPGRPIRDYAAIATPPFHGPNALVIEGWHFRNDDNSGPNEPGPKNLNPPQRGRGFFFVPTEADYFAAQAALAVALWPAGRSEAEVQAAGEDIQRIEKAEAILHVEKLELGNLILGKRAWIERMSFTVELLALGG